MAIALYNSFTILLRRDDNPMRSLGQRFVMKQTICLWLGLVTSLATQLAIGGTLNLKLEPDRDYLLKGSPREVVVKIDLGAAAVRKHRERPALNIVAVLDRSGSMAGAKIEN